MSRKEVSDLLEKIQAYRQSFLITNAVIHEWNRVLEPYDYEDVNQKLDEFFKNGDNFGRYPDVYYLIKYLKRTDEKLKIGVSYVNCQICQRLIDNVEYEKHFDRCSSVDYLCRMSEKYFNKNLNKGKMYLATEKEFDDYYWKFCEKLLDVIPEGLEKHTLKNSILSHYGHDIEYGINDVSKELIK
ncbi:MAG: hypothetical protein V8Q75_03555 [Bacilli bacterium]